MAFCDSAKRSGLLRPSGYKDGSPLNFQILQENAREVVTRFDPDTYLDIDDGRLHAIEYNGRVVLNAREGQLIDEDIEVAFDGICRNEANTRLQGFVNLVSKVGVNDRGREGYHTLRVEVDRNPLLVPVRGRPPPVLPQPVKPKIQLLLDEIKNSLHRSEAGPHIQVLGDIGVRINQGPEATLEDLAISQAQLVTDFGTQSLIFQPDPQKGAGGIVKDVPVSDRATLRVVMESGTVMDLPVKGFSLAPKVESEMPLSFESASPAGGLPVEVEASGNMLRIREWRVDIAPSYAPLKEGRVSPGEESPFVEEINEAIRKDEVARLMELFGSIEPFHVSWSFRARNLTTGADVPVRVDTPAAETEIQVELLLLLC